MLISSTNLWKTQTQPVPLCASLMAGEEWQWVNDRAALKGPEDLSRVFCCLKKQFYDVPQEHRAEHTSSPQTMFLVLKKTLQEGFVKEKGRRHRRRCPCCSWCPFCLLYNISLHFVPHLLSSRNCSGSSSCRSMEIWVHAVYVIVASINALLICSGLQSSIRIIHLHARTHARSHARSHARPQNWCFAKKNTYLLTAREMKG